MFTSIFFLSGTLYIAIKTYRTLCAKFSVYSNNLMRYLFAQVMRLFTKVARLFAKSSRYVAKRKKYP